MSRIQSPPGDLRGAFRHLGPGLIITASIVGSGELILTTKLGAEIGFMLLWFIILGCLIKVFLQIEFGRYAVSHGQTTLQALNSIPGPRLIVSWLVWFWMLMFVGTFFQVAGMVGGVATTLKLGGLGAHWSDVRWAAIVCGVTALVLVFGRYRTIEWLSSVMVALFTLFTVAAVVALAWTPYRIDPGDVAKGLSFKLPPNFSVAFAAFGIIGVGASELIYYPYWCLEKGYAGYVGPNDGTQAWRERARGWLRVMKVDAWVSMAIYTTATIAFYLLGAAVLHAKGVPVTDKDLMANLSQMYRESFGIVGFWCYLLGALIVLYSTIYVATASNGRLVADLLRLLGVVRDDSEMRRSQIVRITCVVLPILYFVLYAAIGAPVSLVLVGAFAQALMLPLLAASALYFLYRRSEPALRPGRCWVAFLWASALVVGSVGLYQAWERVGKWFI